MHLLISDIPSLGEVNTRADSSIHLTDFDKYRQMIHRFLQSLKDLRKSSHSLYTKNYYFSSDALDFASHTTQNLNIQLQKPKEMTKVKKRKFAAKRCQKSLFDCFHTREKLATGVSTEVESSAYD